MSMVPPQFPHFDNFIFLSGTLYKKIVADEGSWCIVRSLMDCNRMYLYEKVNELVAECLGQFGHEGHVKTRTLTGEFDRQIVDVMALANRLGKSSNDLAEEVAARLRKYAIFSEVQ